MTNNLKLNKILHFIVLVSLITTLIFSSYFLTKYVISDTAAQLFVQEFGYIGILIISFITGLNMISPVPSTTFTPIFTAGGISIFTVIIISVIGTMLANLLSYAIGILGHDFTKANYPETKKRILKMYSEKKEILPYLVFGFAALIPIPDEIYLIPLGIIGVKMKDFIIPLLLGTIFFQTVTAFGFQNIFQIFLN